MNKRQLNEIIKTDTEKRQGDGLPTPDGYFFDPKKDIVFAQFDYSENLVVVWAKDAGYLW